MLQGATFEESVVRHYLEKQNNETKNAYRAKPKLVRADAGIEETVLAGGYGYRQILELIQNGADAILESRNQEADSPDGHRIHVLLRESCLYVANTGAPLSKEGLDALLLSCLSPKRNNQIGRFGLGFKSLLGIASQADILSRKWGGLIRFDPGRCKEELAVEFGVRVQEAPGLRLAWFLDENDRDDAAILQKMVWAETIVRVAIRQDQGALPSDRLQQEIEKFRAEFLLFFPVSTGLTLDDGKKPPRRLTVEPDNGVCLLHDGEKETKWQITKPFEAAIQDEHAINDATHLHARDTVPIIWAYPQEGGREEVGTFWAFFPTTTPTYLPGILNAPWKLNSDRTAIIGGEWNTALMREAAAMIADALPTLSTADDPGRVLDAFPRELPRKDEPAAPLVEALWAILTRSAVIPDAVGTLRPAADLWCHPRDSAEIAKQWAGLAADTEKSHLTHPSCLTGSRNYRKNRLQELERRLASVGTGETTSRPGLKTMSASDWFGKVASVETAQAAEVLRLADAYKKDCKQNEWESIRNKLAIIPTDSGALLTAEKVVLAPEGASLPDGWHPVARDLAAMEDVKNILDKVMGVKPLDDATWDEVLQESRPKPVNETAEQCDHRWNRFWELLRKAPNRVSAHFCQHEMSHMRVKRRDGVWDRPENVIQTGSIVLIDESKQNGSVLIDEEYHRTDGEMVKSLGISETPTKPETERIGEHSRSYNIWLRQARQYYQRLRECESNRSGARPSDKYLRPISMSLPDGYQFLERLTGMPNVRLTERLLPQIDTYRNAYLGHSTQSEKYPKYLLDHPLMHLLYTNGCLNIGNRSVPLCGIMNVRKHTVLQGVSGIVAILPHLEKLSKLESVFRSSRPTSEDMRSIWQALIRFHSKTEAAELGDLWADSAKTGVIPEQIFCRGKTVSLSEVYVTGSDDLARVVADRGLAAITLDMETRHLWIKNGARDLSELVKPTWIEIGASAALLVTVIPELGDILKMSAKEQATCRCVNSLALSVAGRADPLPCLMQDDLLLLDPTQMRALSRADRLQRILREIHAVGWLETTFEQAMDTLCNAHVEQLRAQIKACVTLPERLLRAVGNRTDPLLQALGNLGNMDFITQCEPERLAEVVLWHLGTATLFTLMDSLKEEGLKPPERWNSDKAQEFVASIGFPSSFAVRPFVALEQELNVSGPIPLPKLHDYQEEVLKSVQRLIEDGTGRRRAIVSLPTGGGKTLVTVQAAVEHVLKSNRVSHCVLWIAQSEELCEQAVQAFRQVWVNKGTERKDLRIIRLWGGNQNPTEQEADYPVVVVATIQTLRNRMDAQGLDWIQKPGLVVMDECHHAITKSYTSVLRWLDAETHRAGAPEKDEPPLIGLSATPFRMDSDESERLAKRFDNRWFPADQESLYQRLLADQVLAQPHDEAIESHAGLTAEEVEALSRIPEPWDSEVLKLVNALEKLNRRLADDVERNDLLLRQIAESEEQHILFFANSVQHAEEIAIRLNLRGIPAAAISGNTDQSARRDFLARFQGGELRVLCNHSVLTTGFDAPKTDMILISRAVFSPVLYMQMVGRGLRGVKNGGTETCRIVTVLDNLGRFKDRHPYHYCHRYFESLKGRGS
jgi:superfamily II DNA or RNA helicase